MCENREIISTINTFNHLHTTSTTYDLITTMYKLKRMITTYTMEPVLGKHFFNTF